RALRLDALRQALLNEVDGIERVGKIGGDPHARRCGFGIVDEPLLGEVAQPLRHQATRLLSDIEADIIERDVEGASCEHDRPGATDQAGADDGDAIVHIHSIFLRSARSSLNACEGPLQVTEPRSSTTVRSDRASTRSRSWSRMISAPSERRWSKDSNSSSVTAGESPWNGSSSSSTRTSPTSARATANICCSPPER